MGLDVHDKDGDRFDTDHFIVHMVGNGLRYRSLYVHEQQVTSIKRLHSVKVKGELSTGFEYRTLNVSNSSKNQKSSSSVY